MTENQTLKSRIAEIERNSAISIDMASWINGGYIDYTKFRGIFKAFYTKRNVEGKKYFLQSMDSWDGGIVTLVGTTYSKHLVDDDTYVIDNLSQAQLNSYLYQCQLAGDDLIGAEALFQEQLAQIQKIENGH